MTRRRREEDQPEGWESFAEEADAGLLRPSAELEDHMQEASEVADAAADPAATSARDGGAELEETRDRLLRLGAEFDNFRKRASREHEEALRFGHEPMARDLLGTVDDLERALEHARSSGAEAGTVEGVELVLRGLQGVLTRYGVEEVDAAGQPFDPKIHEAMAQVPDASVPEGTVTEVFQKGYRLRDRLLRPARVVVATGEEGA